MLIAIEGLDQSGKQTQAERLRDRLKAEGRKSRVVSFPDYGTSIGEEIARALQGEREYGADVMQLLYIANRYERKPDLQRWLDGGLVLVCDRYVASSIAYGEAQGLDPAWLDLTPAAERFPLFPAAHTEHPATRGPPPRSPTPGRPVRYETAAGPRLACGWVFGASDEFVEEPLLKLLGSDAGVTRLKGVFRLADEWAAVNRVGGSMTVSPTAYRRDSRVEVFVGDGPPTWDALERSLLACLADQHPRRTRTHERVWRRMWSRISDNVGTGDTSTPDSVCLCAGRGRVGRCAALS